MASLSEDANGNRTIQFLAGDGKRRSIRLGKVPSRIAQEVRLRIEYILAAKSSGLPLDAETARWISQIDFTTAEKLAAVSLIPSRERPVAETLTLAAFIEQYIAGRLMKPNTLKNYKATERKLIEFFGKDRVLADITPGDCDEWHSDQVAKEYAAATIGRDVKRARQFFRAAVRKKIIAENPFAEIKASSSVNKSRQFFVTVEMTAKLLAECPDTQWQLIVALARFGGLRTPSETYALRWGDVDWERGRMRVISPKTAHNVGGESRVIPIFPELRPYLEAAFDEAEPGTEHVISRYRKGSDNLRTQLQRIIERAGLTAWPRLFQNMRASRETELTHQHPLHVVVAWIGNSAPIAAQHYLQVTDLDFDRAVQTVAKPFAGALQNPVQQPTETPSNDLHDQNEKKSQNPIVLDFATSCDYCIFEHIPPRGVEPRFSD